jgi:hypothetical protein
MIDDLEYSKINPINIFSNDLGHSIKILERDEGMINLLLQICCTMYKQPNRDKIEIIKTSRFYSLQYKIGYARLVSDGVIRQMMNKISSTFRMHLPTNFLRTIGFTKVSDICNAAINGNNSEAMAFRKCKSLAGKDRVAQAESLHLTMTLPSLHFALAKAWEIDPGIAAKGPREQLSRTIPCLAASDACHTHRYGSVMVTDDHRMKLAMRALARVKTVYICSRTINIPARYTEDIGLLTFLPGGSVRAYHIFPQSRNPPSHSALKNLAGMLATKTLITFHKNRLATFLKRFEVTAGDCTDVGDIQAAKEIKGNSYPYRMQQQAKPTTLPRSMTYFVSRKMRLSWLSSMLEPICMLLPVFTQTFLDRHAKGYCLQAICLEADKQLSTDLP